MLIANGLRKVDMQDLLVFLQSTNDRTSSRSPNT